MREICWSKEWIQPYESFISIIEKIKIANVIQSKDIIDFFGTSLVKNHKSPIRSLKLRNLYTMAGFDFNLFMEYTGIDLNLHKTLVGEICNLFSGGNKIQYLYKHYLSYCDECLQYNYHSILHQLEFAEICPYHLKKLVNRCPSCSNFILYFFSYKSQFQCECGFIATQYTYNLNPWSNWGGTNLEIQSELFQKMDNILGGRIEM